MGPRPFGRGNDAVIKDISEAITTSMGPRPFGRGNFGHPKKTAGDWTNFNGAAAFRSRKCPGVRTEATEALATSMGPTAFRSRKCRDSSTRMQLPRRCFNGAAAFRSRKSPGVISPSGLDGPLQWGRRPFGRGNAERVAVVSLLKTTSMGPRPFGRGNGRPAASPGSPASYFNGAAAFRSRKCRAQCPRSTGCIDFNGADWPFGRGNQPSHARCSLARADFNGAAAFRSRKCRFPHRPRIEQTRTSMGPRPFGRGNAEQGPRTRPCTCRLQWGRGLSVAEMARQLFAPLIRDAALQWGRGLSVAEIISICTISNSNSILQWGRGLSVAEMRLRPQLRKRPWRLQWGRRPFGRGNRSFQDRQDVPLGTLQWGRRPFGRGNTYYVQTAPQGLMNFNGAAAFRSRKWRRADQSDRSRRGTSMGPRPFGRGNHVAKRRTAELGLTSMGPRPFGRGNDEPARRRRWNAIDFNGAAAFRSRKSGRIASPRRLPPRLQWGRGLSVAEMAESAGRPETIGALQWGRGLSVAEIPGPHHHRRGTSATSMGPRPFGRGNIFPRVRIHIHNLTSMGPRPFGRGNYYRRNKRWWKKPELQWGRGLSVAEIGNWRNEWE